MRGPMRIAGKKGQTPNEENDEENLLILLKNLPLIL